MSELSARLSIYAAIDRAVAGGDPDGWRRAAEVLPVYRLDFDESAPDEERRGTRGWNEQLSTLLDGFEPNGLEAALAELRGLTDPSELDQAQRLRAAWVLVQVLPGETEAEQVAGTLVPLVRAALEQEKGEEVDEEIVTQRANELVGLLADGQFATAEAWPKLVEKALERNLIT